MQQQEPWYLTLVCPGDHVENVDPAALPVGHKHLAQALVHQHAAGREGGGREGDGTGSGSKRWHRVDRSARLAAGLGREPFPNIK